MGQVLAWFCLVLVACTSAYAMQLTAAAIEPAVVPNQVTSTPFSRKVLIVAFDPVTGDRAQVECDAPANTFTSGAVVVDANDFSAVARVCTCADASAVHA